MNNIIYLFLTNLLFINAFNFNSKYNSWFSISMPMKNLAKNWFISRAEKKGIDWNYYKNQYKNKESELQLIQDLISNKFLYYPMYYKKPFHGYNNGNLNWEAAFEGVGATLSMSSNYWFNVNPKDAHSWLRGNYTNNIKKNYNNYNKNFNSLQVLDLGCSVGIGTEFLNINLPKPQLTGLDLSPFFIAIARFRSLNQNLGIQYIHNNAEYLPFKKDKYDLVTAQFLFHEVPLEPSLRILKDSYRVMKNDSIIAIIDLDPDKLINNFVFKNFRKWLFEITEPYMKEYYNKNMTQMLSDSGFIDVVKYDNNDPFNSVWLGYKPGKDLKLKNYIKNKLLEQDNIIEKSNKDIEYDYIDGTI